MRVEAVLMEFDGVLADTTPHRLATLREVLAEAGVDLADEVLDALGAGLHPADAVRAAAAAHLPGMDETGRDLLALRAGRGYSAAIARGVILTEGARGTLDRLAGSARLGIVSRLRRSDLALLLAAGDLEDYFSLVIGAEDASPRKPSPAPYRAALARLERKGAAPGGGAVVALEDCMAGIRSARAAGARCLAVGSLPAHVALEAEGYLPSLAGHDVESLGSLLDIRDHA